MSDPTQFHPEFEPDPAEKLAVKIPPILGFGVIDTLRPTKTVGLGRTNLTLYMPGVPASAQVYGNITQTSGAAWNWYSADVNYTNPVIHL